jgi:hypothetical protein
VKGAFFRAFFGGLLNLSVAHAQEPTGAPGQAALRLTEWDAPPTCIALPDLRARVKTQMMGEPSVIREVRGNMLRGPAGWIASFTVYDADQRLGERILELSGEECRAHDETLALVIALLLEHGPPPPEGEAPAADPQKTEDETAKAPKEEQEAKEPEPSPVLPAQEKAPVLRLRGGLGFQAISGWLPSVALGPSAFLGAEIFERASIELVGDYYLGQETEGPLGASVRTSGGRAHLRGCGLPQFGRWGASGCFGFGWMALAASGQDVLRPKEVLHGSFETSAALGLTYRLTERFGLKGEVEGTAPFRRGRFVFERGPGVREVHQTSALVFASYVGVVLTL